MLEGFSPSLSHSGANVLNTALLIPIYILHFPQNVYQIYLYPFDNTANIKTTDTNCLKAYLRDFVQRSICDCKYTRD